jgi:hypothetical protein
LSESRICYWLCRYGFDPTVVAPASRNDGFAIDLRGTAREVAKRMGIMADLRRASLVTCGMSYDDSTNKRLASMSANLLSDSGGAGAEDEAYTVTVRSLPKAREASRCSVWVPVSRIIPRQGSARYFTSPVGFARGYWCPLRGRSLP